jgi:hypothetical protein
MGIYLISLLRVFLENSKGGGPPREF